jgi:ADP-heptose:LPS heptosyltransferase
VRRLLIRPGAIGDCILSIPALRYLKATYTEVWVPTTIVPLIQFADKVRSISSTGLNLVGIGDLGIPTALREALQSFDSIISWYGANRLEFREAMLSLGVPCEFHTALPPAEFNEHATDFFARQVGAPVGCIPQIAVEPCLQRSTVMIHPFSGSARKNWPLDSFFELAKKLSASVEWTAGPEEQLPAPLVPTHFSSLLDLARWLKGARLYIGNDSGITHLAAATGVKTLALFGETKPDIWAPRGANVTVLQSTPLAAMSVHRVLEAANQLLD